MPEIMSYIAILISALTLVVLVAEKLFGGGNALAARFHRLDKDVTDAIAEVRKELTAKIDEYEDNAGVGFETIKNNIHEMQIGLLKFRAEISESLHLYIRKDDYNAGLQGIKRDVLNGFRSVDERLAQLQDLIMHVSPDPRPLPPK